MPDWVLLFAHSKGFYFGVWFKQKKLFSRIVFEETFDLKREELKL